MLINEEDACSHLDQKREREDVGLCGRNIDIEGEYVCVRVCLRVCVVVREREREKENA